MKQTTSFWERLKICYKVLTLDYYVYFGLVLTKMQYCEKRVVNYKGLDEKGFVAIKYCFENLI